MLKPRFSKLWYLVGALLLANVAAGAAVQNSRPADHVRLEFFDVGQGDAAYLRTPEGNDVVIDTGPGEAVLSKLGRAMPHTDRTIELVVLTHPHADHISGMVEILKRYRVEKVMLPEADYDSATYRALLDLLAREEAQIIRPRLGQRVFLDSSTVMDIIYPVLAERQAAPPDINDVSVVARLSFGRMNVLLTGDSGKNIENFILDAGLPLEAEILKVGHHGSRHSTSEKFLGQVQPRYSVISVGKNSYGHPHEEVLGALQEADTETLRTDEGGDIRFLIYPDQLTRLR